MYIDEGTNKQFKKIKIKSIFENVLMKVIIKVHKRRKAAPQVQTDKLENVN
jgi:hypothetical protein